MIKFSVHEFNDFYAAAARDSTGFSADYSLASVNNDANRYLAVSIAG